MTKKDFKPVTAQEITDLTAELAQKYYDNESAHGAYDDILERYCLYPNRKLAPLIEALILTRQEAEFWYG